MSTRTKRPRCTVCRATLPENTKTPTCAGCAGQTVLFPKRTAQRLAYRPRSGQGGA
jgi:hypothetical protein